MDLVGKGNEGIVLVCAVEDEHGVLAELYRSEPGERGFFIGERVRLLRDTMNVGQRKEGRR